MKTFQKDTQLTLLSRLPVMLLSFMGMTILTRWLGPEGNGVYTFLFTNINVLLLLLGLQSEPALMHYLARDEAKSNEIITTSLISFIGSVLLCLCMVGVGGLLLPVWKSLLLPGSHPYTYFLFFIVASFIFRKSFNITLTILRARLAFSLYTRLQLWAQFIPVVAYLAGILFIVQTEEVEKLILIFNIILGSQFAIAFLGWVYVCTKWPFQWTWKVNNHIRPFLSFSLKTTIDALAKFINRRIDVYFVQAFQGIQSLGQYGLASQINSFTQEAVLPVTQVMNPYLVKSEESTRRDMVTRMARIVMAITFLMAVCIATFSTWAIPLLFGDAFIPAITATQILSLAIMINALRLVFAGYFQATNQQRYSIQGNWLGVVITVLLDIWLIPRLGIEGAAIASVVAYSVSLVYMTYWIRQKTQLDISDIFIVRKSDINWLLQKNKK